MTESFLHDFMAYSRCNQDRCMGSSEVMKSDAGQSCSDGRFLEYTLNEITVMNLVTFRARQKMSRSASQKTTQRY